MQPGDYDAITFDVYGTLIDWEPTILDTLEKWAARNDVTTTRDALLDAFDRARTHYQTLEPCRDYPRILRSAFAYIADEHGVVPDPAEQQAFAASVGDWPPYEDSIAALARLKERFTLGAYTNMDDAPFAKSHTWLDHCFEIVVTAERAQAYKPALRHFILGLTDLAARNIPPGRVLHVAQSLRADVRPANLLGQGVIWINRTGRGLGHTGFGAELADPMASFTSMKEFVDAFFAA